MIIESFRPSWRKSFCLVVSLMAIGVSHAQDVKLPDLDQSESLIDSLNAANELCEYYVYNDSDLAEQYGKLLMELSQQYQDSSWIVQAHLMFGKVKAFSGNWGEAKDIIKQVEDYSLRTGNGRDNLCNYLGNIYSSILDLDSSKIYYQLAAKYAEDTVNKAVILSNIVVFTLRSS